MIRHRIAIGTIILVLSGLAAVSASSPFDSFIATVDRCRSASEIDAALCELRSFDRAALSGEARWNYDLAEWFLEDRRFRIGEALASSHTIGSAAWLRHHTTTTWSAERWLALASDELAACQRELPRLLAAADLPTGPVEVWGPALEVASERAARAVSGPVAEQMQAMVDEAGQRCRSVFGRYPSDPIDVVVVPGILSISGYRPGSPAAGRPEAAQIRGGIDGVPAYLRRTVAHHEAFPGHYVQEAVLRTLVDLPRFRRLNEYRAFGEGWARYAEQLAAELGLFAGDPLGDLGRVVSRLRRAVLAAVDVGVHALGWSDDEALRSLRKAFSEPDTALQGMVHGIRRSPGQAIGAYAGSACFRILRERMRDRLGDRFSMRDFHVVVLEGGAMPMEILERRVEAAIDEE